MLASQEEAFNKAYEILSEHFDNCLIIIGATITIKAEVADGAHEEQDAEEFDMRHSGSRSAAVGLCEMAKHNLLVPAHPDSYEEK